MSLKQPAAARTPLPYVSHNRFVAARGRCAGGESLLAGPCPCPCPCSIVLGSCRYPSYPVDAAVQCRTSK